MQGKGCDEEPGAAGVTSGWTPVPDTLIIKFDTLTALVWGRVWRYEQKRGYSFASLGTIARELGISRETVKRRTKILLVTGFIEDVRDHPGKHIGTVRYFKTTKKLTLKFRIGMEDETRITKAHVSQSGGQKEPDEDPKGPQRENVIDKKEEEGVDHLSSSISRKLLELSPHVSSPQNKNLIHATNKLVRAGVEPSQIDKAVSLGYVRWTDPHPSQLADGTLRYAAEEKLTPAQRLGVQIYAGPSNDL